MGKNVPVLHPRTKESVFTRVPPGVCEAPFIFLGGNGGGETPLEGAHWPELPSSFGAMVAARFPKQECDYGCALGLGCNTFPLQEFQPYIWVHFTLIFWDFNLIFGVHFTLIFWDFNLILGFISLLSFGTSIFAFHSYIWGFKPLLFHTCTLSLLILQYLLESWSCIAQGSTNDLKIHTKVGSRNGAGMANISVRISLLFGGG